MDMDQNMDQERSLYRICLHAYVTNLSSRKVSGGAALKILAPSVLSDIFTEMVYRGVFDELYAQLSDLDLFTKLIRFRYSRQILINCVSALMLNKKPIADSIAKSYVEQVSTKTYETDAISSIIDNGIRIGAFLNESGWLEQAMLIFTNTLRLIHQLEPSYENLIIELNCLQKLLSVQTAFCCSKDAAISVASALQTVDKLAQFHEGDVNRLPSALLANMYHQISVLHFFRSDYDLSYTFSKRSLQYLKEDIPKCIVPDILRQAAKACVVKRRFNLANMLIKQAVSRAKQLFGDRHQKYSDALMDYAFFLLNVDSTQTSVKMYKQALEIRLEIFGPKNIYVSISNEDLGYALYVAEYSSGRFQAAREHVERAIEVMMELVPSNHLMLASAKRVKALILEEIALDNLPINNSEEEGSNLLEEAEILHKSALKLSLEAFGEKNVQTAKHFGNLGRLYQSMNKFEQAEVMHKRAIKIKTDLLGCYDYEVGLSIGHLASLYNYHMNRHRDALILYQKSIEISLKLFGPHYSGLEYDYRGLIFVFENLNDHENVAKYSDILDEWRMLRAELDEDSNNGYIELKNDSTLEEITKKFFDLCSVNVLE